MRDTFGFALRCMSKYGSEIDWLVEVINRALENEARKGNYTLTIKRNKKYLENAFGDGRRYLDDYLWDNFSELSNYYKSQDISLRYISNSKLQSIQGYFIFDWSDK